MSFTSYIHNIFFAEQMHGKAALGILNLKAKQDKSRRQFAAHFHILCTRSSNSRSQNYLSLH